MISTIYHKIIRKTSKKIWMLVSVIFWLIVWEIVSIKLGQEILLVSPVSAIKRLYELLLTKEFWFDISVSSFKIMSGFLIGFLIACILAIISTSSSKLSSFIDLPVQTVQTVPVVSFIILCMIWIKPSNLNFFISMIMAIPIVYKNLVNGILNISTELIDMAKVFRVSKYKKIRYIYLSQLQTSIISAISVSIGLCWKAGIAAEVISLQKYTIGESLHNAKIYLSTADLFALTIVIVVLSILFKKITIKLANIMIKQLLK